MDSHEINNLEPAVAAWGKIELYRPKIVNLGRVRYCSPECPYYFPYSPRPHRGPPHTPSCVLGYLPHTWPSRPPMRSSYPTSHPLQGNIAKKFGWSCIGVGVWLNHQRLSSRVSYHLKISQFPFGHWLKMQAMGLQSSLKARLWTAAMFEFLHWQIWN